jgi:endonuclease/exonuclease/phosphatase family metal-dependent hydrolase
LSLIAQMNDLEASDAKYAGLPVIYAGDTNSYAGSNPDNYDSPGDLFAADGATDSLMAAQKATNTKYGSVNGYTPKPSQTGRIIDHLYGTGGAAFQSWNQVMNLKNGRWPDVVPSDHNPIMAQVSVQS